MIDIVLKNDGDILVSETGDISVASDISQDILLRLRWINGEWRLGPDLGFTWLKDVFVKNPNLDNIAQLIRSEILGVEGVKNATAEVKSYDKVNRTVEFEYTFSTEEGTYKKEVTLNV